MRYESWGVGLVVVAFVSLLSPFSSDYCFYLFFYESYLYVSLTLLVEQHLGRTILSSGGGAKCLYPPARRGGHSLICCMYVGRYLVFTMSSLFLYPALNGYLKLGAYLIIYIPWFPDDLSELCRWKFNCRQPAIITVCEDGHTSFKDQ